MMKAIRILCLFTVCLSLVLMGETPCNAAPRARVDRDVYNAGMVPDGTEVTHEFLFTNAGDKVLIIKPRAC